MPTPLPTRLLATAFAYLFSLGVVGVVAFFVVIILAGPHSGLLSEWAADGVLMLGWLAVLLVPAMIARRVWRRCAGEAPSP